MSNPLQQTLPANAPAAFSSNTSKGVDSGEGKIKSNYEFGLPGATHKSNAVSAPVRNGKPKQFDKPEDRGSSITRSSQMKVTPATSPRN